MKVDSDSDLTFVGHWYVDGFNTTSVIEKMQNGGWKHICTCDYGYDKPLEHLQSNKALAHKIALLPYLIERLEDTLLDLDSANLSSPHQMAEAIRNSIETIDGILQEYKKELKY